MKILTLEVCDPSEVMDQFVQTWKTGISQESNRIAFATPELLWQVLSVDRWALLKALCGSGPISVDEIAKRMDRDHTAVYADIAALIDAGVLSRVDEDRIEFPFDAVKVEFLLKAA